MAFDVGAITARLELKKDQWDKSVNAINKSQKEMTKQVGKTSKAISGMWKQIFVGVGITNVVSGAIRGLKNQIADTVRVGRSFEKEWANVTTMLSVSREESDKLRMDLRRLSPTLGDTTDLARGMYQVLSASIEPAKAIELLGTAARSAKAGVTDTATAVDAITTVINAYGLEAEAATEISDLMFGTVKRGKLTYEELAHSIGTVVPVAATVGIEFREIAAATATLTRQGIQASKATMQLRQVIMSVLSASEETRKKARDLGFEFSAQALKAKGLGQFIFDLQRAVGGNNELLKVFVPNVRALSGVMALGGKAAAGFAKDLDFLKEVAGFTDEALAKQMETADFWAETFKVAADKVKISAYEGFIDPLRETIKTTEDFDEKVTQKVNRFAVIAEEAGTAAHKAAGILAKFLKVRVAIDPFNLMIKTGTQYLDEHTVSLETVTAAAKDMVDEIRAETEKTDVANAAQQRMTETINTQLPSLGSLRFNYETLGWELVEYTEILKKATDAQKDFGQTAYHEMLPPAKSITGILEGAAWQAENFEDNVYSASEGAKKDLAAFASEAGSIMSGMGAHNKALAYTGAIVNTAAGVTMALKHYPPPLSIWMAAIQSAAGAVQIATIEGTPVPSAEKGAYLPSPAIIEAGHGPMGEVVMPLDKAPIELMKGGHETIGGAKVDFNFFAPLISTTGIADSDLSRVSAELFHKMEEEARRRGYSLNGS